MGTPVQYVPEEFQQTVNLPAESMNQQALINAQRAVRNLSGDIKSAVQQRAGIYNRLRDKNLKLSKEERSKLLAQADRLSTRIENKREARLEKREIVYVHSGQYEKLLGDPGTRDAFNALRSLFNNYGLGSLAPKIYEYVKNGYSADTITILLQDTKEYKERFKGNELRASKGLPVLSPAEYLSVEASYQQIMQSAGMPKGFYDNPADFRDWIGKNISPSEIQSRVDLATQAVRLSNPEYLQALKQMGVDESQLTAYFLDSKRALPALQESAAIAATGAEAIRQGLTFDRGYAERLVQQGISQEEASQGYSVIAQELGTMQALGSIYGQNWNQREAEQAILEGEGAAMETRRKLIGREQAEFSGAVGGARAGLAQRGGAR
jgi:hypothetical protein